MSKNQKQIGIGMIKYLSISMNENIAMCVDVDMISYISRSVIASRSYVARLPYSSRHQ